MHLFHDVLVEPESVHGLEDILGAALVSHQIVVGARARARERSLEFYCRTLYMVSGVGITIK